jgi:hypothetical protein
VAVTAGVPDGVGGREGMYEGLTDGSGGDADGDGVTLPDDDGEGVVLGVAVALAVLLGDSGTGVAGADAGLYAAATSAYHAVGICPDRPGPAKPPVNSTPAA